MDGLLNGRYELGEIVGLGGMGAVYRAIDTRLGRTVAVKVLRGSAVADDAARARLRSEALLASSVHHRGVAQVYDYDASSPTHGGKPFIVMEHVDGKSLAQLLRSGGAMPTDQVMSIVQQVAEALTAAHAAGIVHRDLKPANIMLTPAGRAVLIDFGIASSSTSDLLTETGLLLGTAEYLSPEQAAGRSATPKSDLYSLGVVAHHCVTGTSPFRRENPFATAFAQVRDELPALDDSVPARVRDLVDRLTQKSPSDRPDSAADVAREAAAIGAVAPAPLPSPSSAASGPSPRRPVSHRATTRRRPLAVFSGLGVFSAAAGTHQVGCDPPEHVTDVVA